jgi:hypothetical protein
VSFKNILARDVRNLQKKLTTFGRRTEHEIRVGVKRIASHALRRLIQETPKGHTGEVRRSWKMRFNGTGSWFGFEVSNSSQIMRYLEFGTRAHGPRRAKFLFVPLTRKARMGGGKGLTFGKDYVLAKRVSGIKGLKIVDKRQRIVMRMGRVLKNKVAQVLGEIFNG